MAYYSNQTPEYAQVNNGSNNYQPQPRQRKRRKKVGLLSKIRNSISGGSFDYILFLIVIGLATAGVCMILSASFYNAIDKYGDGYYYFTRQLRFAMIGLVVMLIISKIDYLVRRRFAFWAYLVSIGLQVWSIFNGLSEGGASRWIEIGGVNFQPSELLKIATVMYLALFLEKRTKTEDYPRIEGESNFVRFFRIWKKELIVLAISCFLIVIENWSTAFVLGAVGMLMMGVAGMKIEKAIPWLLIFVALLYGFILIGGIGKLQEIMPAKYHRRLERFETWVDPFDDPIDTGYQTVQSLYAIGSGGITGVGLGKSKQKLGFIPDSQNDMIFCIICEEFGLIGAIVLLSIFMFLIWRMARVSSHAPDKFSSFLTFGILAIIAMQVIVNVGVVTGTIPNTGQPLPFISYGGTSLLMFMASMGIVLNVSRYTD